MAIESPTFQAVWNQQNIHLKTQESTLVQKVGKVAWDILSIVILPIGIARAIGWAVHFLAQKLALPSACAYSNETVGLTKKTFDVFCQSLKPTFQTQKYQIKTPDGALLNAIHFKHQRADNNTPTVLFFHSNCAFVQQIVYGWLIEESLKRGCVCNFVAFDYRGVVDSSGEITSPKDLKIDGDSAYQFVRDQLNVPAEKIHYYGWSLGGAIATNTKAIHPESTGPFCNIRSFSSSKEVTRAITPPYLKPLLFWLPWAIEKQEWNLVAPLEKLKGPTLIAYHKEDQTTPYNASAYLAAASQKLPFQAIELQYDKAKASHRKLDHHIEPLENYYSAPNRRADQAIADFILPQHA